MARAHRADETTLVQETLGLRGQSLVPVLSVFFVMSLSWLVYNLAWRLAQPSLHHKLAVLSGTLLLASVSFVSSFVYPMAASRGAPLAERVVACWVNPFIWATMGCIRLSVSLPKS